MWIADRASAFVAIAAVARGAAALVTTDAVSETAIAVAQQAQLPMVSSVHIGLFGWARPGDLLAVDGSEGVVLVCTRRAERHRADTARHARQA